MEDLEPLVDSLREAPVVQREDYEYFVHGVTDGVPVVEPAVLEAVAAGIEEAVDLDSVDLLVAPEAMGIHHATALSLATGIPFVVVRKRSYGFEDELVVHQETNYGESELHVNGIGSDDRVVLVDDVLSSGSTIRAVYSALEEIGADVADVVVVARRVDSDRPEFPVEVKSLIDLQVTDGAVEIVDTV